MKEKILKGLATSFVPIGVLSLVMSAFQGLWDMVLIFGVVTAINFHIAFIKEEPKNAEEA